MIYALTYKIEGICGPGGFIDTSLAEVVDFAKSMAEIALDQFGDAVSLSEWYDLGGEETDPRQLLQTSDIDEIQNVIVQISDTLKTDQMGFIDLWVYEDIFQLIEDQDVTSWCSRSLKEHIANARKVYFGLVQKLANEWVDA